METKHAAPSPETRAALHELLAAFEAFKAANDQRLDELERKSAPDVLLEEKVARIDAALASAQQKLDRQAAALNRPALSGGAEVKSSPEGGEAFARYLRTGQSPAGREVKGLSEGGSGGYLAPPEVERAIARRMTHASPIREIATVRTIGTSLYRKPVSIAGPVVGWAAETASRAETTAPTLDQLDFPAADLFACPAATQALLDDGFVNLEAWLAEECQDAFAAQETDAFVNGDGANKPKGFLSYTPAPDASQAWGQLGYLATGAAGAFPAENPADRLIDLIYAPRAEFRAQGRFVMNRRTSAAVRKFKDGDGNYVWTPPAVAGQPANLLGYPVTEVESMPDVGANAFAVAFGDFARGYLIVDRAGLGVLRDPYSAKPYVLFYVTKRVGGGVQNFDAIKLLKFAAS